MTLALLLLLASIHPIGAIIGVPTPITLFIVTTTADHNDHVCDSDCTLREAIGAANTTAGNCVITFSIPTSDPGYSSGVWTITLGSALPDLHTSNGASNLSISGPGAEKLTVQRILAYGSYLDPHYRIFNVTTSGTVSISGMTINHGGIFSPTDYLGAGIQNYNAGIVNLTNCVFTDNRADRYFDSQDNPGPHALGGAVANRAGGVINITSSTIGSVPITSNTFTAGNGANYGGGIYNSGSGTINITNSIIGGSTFGNYADNGGGIYNDGIINVTGTTFGNNSAFSGGGGIYNNGTLTVTGSTFESNNSTQDGGGIYNTDTAAVSVSNSTFYFNFTSGIDSSRSASGGAIFNANALSVFDSTFTLNHVDGYGTVIAGGAIFNNSGATANIKSTIIAGNYFPPGVQANVVGGPDLYGSFTSQGYNLIGLTDGSTGFISATDLTGSGLAPVDPKFEFDSNNAAILRDNGGPTQTVALLCGSPAIDQGTSNGLTGALTTDQRGSGFPRTFNDSAVTNADDGTDMGAFELQQNCIALTCNDVIFSENFDGLTAPSLPAGWTATDPDVPVREWATSSTTPDGSPNDAFASDPATEADARLTSPVIAIPSSFAKLIFRNNYNLYSAGGPGSVSDGGVLEISINGGAFTDVVDAGGSFVSGGYNTFIDSNPVGCCNRSVWSGNSNGYVTTIVNLPPSAGGKNIQLRWRLGSVQTSTGGSGWRIDTIKILGCTPPTELANVSTRAFVQTGDNVAIGGFIITGSGPKKVILRAIGPSLTQYHIANPLADPVIELHNSSRALIASNDNWMDASNHQAISDSGLAPSNNLESAILTSLDPGAYTAIVRGVNNGTGVALFEGYDLDRTASSKLGNISTRGFVQTGDNVMIGGLIISGASSEDVIVRAIGPSLTQYGVANALADPMLELHDSNGALIVSNDNWKDTQQTEIQATGLAPSYDAESAIVRTLSPGNYTAIVRGKNNTTGVALVEVYSLN